MRGSLLLLFLVPASQSASVLDPLYRIERSAEQVRLASVALEEVSREIQGDGRIHSIPILRVRMRDLEREVQSLERLVQRLEPTAGR